MDSTDAPLALKIHFQKIYDLKCKRKEEFEIQKKEVRKIARERDER